MYGVAPRKGKDMKKFTAILSLGIMFSLLFACMPVNTMSRMRILELGISLPDGQKGLGSKSIVEDSAVLSVTVTAEDSSGTILGTADMTEGSTAWTGTMTITLKDGDEVIFRARGWSAAGGSGSLLYYGTLTKTVNLAEDPMSVTIEAAPQLLTWTARCTDTTRSWFGIASSSDGSGLVATVNNGYIYTSSDGGANWTARCTDAARAWRLVASSSDGTKLAAAQNGGSLYFSSDYGQTWATTNAGSGSWYSVASSSDGTKLIAGKNSSDCLHIGQYSSDTSSWTWTSRQTDENRLWISVASSSDGTKLAAVVQAATGCVWTSSDSGATWTERASSGERYWRHITSSSDGVKLAATATTASYGSEYIYTSSDSGVTWTQRTSAGERAWMGIASSSDGTKLAAGVNNGYIYTSPDSGEHWTEQTGSGARSWYYITSSSDGTKLAATVSGGYIYTGTN